MGDRLRVVPPFSQRLGDGGERRRHALGERLPGLLLAADGRGRRTPTSVCRASPHPARSSSSNSCVRLTLFVQLVRIRNRTMSDTISSGGFSTVLVRELAIAAIDADGAEPEPTPAAAGAGAAAPDPTSTALAAARSDGSGRTSTRRSPSSIDSRARRRTHRARAGHRSRRTARRHRRRNDRHRRGDELTMVPVIHRGGAGGEKLISYLTHDREADTADRLGLDRDGQPAPGRPRDGRQHHEAHRRRRRHSQTRRCGRTARGVLAR